MPMGPSTGAAPRATAAQPPLGSGPQPHLRPPCPRTGATPGWTYRVVPIHSVSGQSSGAAPASGMEIGSESDTDMVSKLHNINSEINSLDNQIEKLIQKKQELMLERNQKREKEKPYQPTEGSVPSSQSMGEESCKWEDDPWGPADDYDDYSLGSPNRSQREPDNREKGPPRAESPSLPSHSAPNKPLPSYDFTLPCPGEEYRNGESCPFGNLCRKCRECKVCGHCVPSCPEYIDLTPAPADQPARTPSEERREKERNRKRKERANETKEQRNARLLKARENSASRRAKIACSHEEKLAHNKCEAERRKAQWKYETPEVKEAILQNMREQKKIDREYETTAQREVRLQKMREYSASRRADKKVKETDKERQATKERMAAFRANRPIEKVIQDQEKAREGMAKLRESRSDPNYEVKDYKERRKSKNHHDFNCEVRKWRLKVAKGEGAGPEPLLTNGKPKYCHDCDQDLKVPLAGVGRCDCLDCAKMFGKAEEWWNARGHSLKKSPKK